MDVKKIMGEIILMTGIFSVLFVASFSFPFAFLPDVGGLLEPAFNHLVKLEAELFNFEVTPFHSGEDSLGMLVNTINIFVLSLLVYVLLTFRLKDSGKAKMITIINVWLRYYLATILLIYGFDKVYKWQFYAPESNILYTRVKDLPQDMLYWTTMGTSYGYSVFTGVLEVLAGTLLLFRKTYVIGVLLGGAVLANVFAVNLGFDITVKLFSGFLMLLSGVLLLPFIGSMITFFSGKPSSLKISHPEYAEKRFYIPVKIVTILLILIASQYKYFATCNFNDDLAPRPHFNGVYEVVQSSDQAISRVHFHRQGYFILELKNGGFLDYQLAVDSKEQFFTLTDYTFDKICLGFQEKEDTLFIQDADSTFSIIAVKHHL